MNLPLLGAYALAVFLLISTPGPVVALVTGTAARSGLRQAFCTLLGTNLASLVLIALAVMMLTGVLSINAWCLPGLGLIGCGYIGYQALGDIRAAGRPYASQNKAAGSGLAGGFMMGVSNPKDILFFVSFFPQFVAITENFTASITLLSIVWIFFDFTILSGYILAVGYWGGNYPERHQRLARLSAWVLLFISCAGIGYNLKEAFNLLSASG